MEEDKLFDAVILGASGFTGKHVVRYMISLMSTHYPDLKVAIAGRSRTKLSDTLRWASPSSLPFSVPIIEADVGDTDSLAEMCKKTKLVVNCVGPFRLYGEPVVAACVASGVDYLDITGEPEFMERTEYLFHQRAVETGSLVVSACGYDSIPAELGLLYHSRQWEPPSVPHSVDSYLELISDQRIVGNFGTYESAVLGVANAEGLQELRRSRPRRPRPNIPGPPAEKAKILAKNKALGLWTLKLPSADAIVARRTQAIMVENPHGLAGLDETSEFSERREKFWSEVKPMHFGVYIGFKSLWNVVGIAYLGLMLALFARCGWGRSLLLKYPEFFSMGVFRKTGPTEAQINSASFRMTFLGKGYSDESLIQRPNSKPNMGIVTAVSGPEVGYVTTPIVLVQCALTLINQRKNLPKGGVFPPGIVFGPTDLQERLEESGLKFEVLKKELLS